MSNKNRYLLCLILVAVAVVLGIGGYLFFDSRNSKYAIKELAEVAHGSSSIETEAAIMESSDDIPESSEEISTEVAAEKIEENKVEADNSASSETVEAVSSNAIDIASLQNTNPDIIAWISIPGTVIDYPIVQHPTDDSYYLSHGPEGIKSSHGCPFIETCDSKNFQDFNTVIYGHNMNDGSMFAALHKFEDRDFLNKHREITISTAEHVMTYTIFAAVMYSDAYIPYYFDDSAAEGRASFLQSLGQDIVPERSIVLDDMKVGTEDQIITLSTCDKKLRDNRFLVVAVLKQIDGMDV